MAMTHSQDTAEFVIVGAGIFGLATAYHLSLRTSSRIILVDQHSVGHSLGSSHGRVRIARSAYADKGYAHLMRRAFDEAWTELALASNRTLLRPSPACIFGPPGGYIEDYAAGLEHTGIDIDELNPAQAAEYFPHLHLTGQRILKDNTSAIIDAAATRYALLELMKDRKVESRFGLRVTHIDQTKKRLYIHTNKGLIKANRMVITAGPWTQNLIPELQNRLLVNRQNVGFYRPNDARAFSNSTWIYVGTTIDELYYGLPEDPMTAKAAAHIRNGPPDDPGFAHAACPEALCRVDDFMKRHWTLSMQRVASDTCPYTSTPTDDFIIDHHPQDQRIIVAAGFSGHGFKFGPLVGRVLAEMSLTGHTTVDEFIHMRQKFKF